MSDQTIQATTRTEFGKGAARRTRRAGLVPAVVYGHGSDPIHLSLPAHATQMALRVANAVLELSIDGKKTQLALAKQVQRNPIRDNVEHVDLVIVKKGEKVTVEVPLLVVGDAPSEGLVLMDLQTISLEVEATNIPADVEINIAGLPVGTAITAADLVLPAGAVFHGEPDALVLTINAAPTQAEMEAAGGEAEAEEAPAEEE